MPWMFINFGITHFNRLCVNKKVFDGKHKHAKEKRQENGVCEKFLLRMCPNIDMLISHMTCVFETASRPR